MNLLTLDLGCNKQVVAEFNTKNKNASSPSVEGQSFVGCKEMLYNTPSSVSAAVISFGRKKKMINLDSKKYSETIYFPNYKKVPDGFKYLESHSEFSDKGITKKGELDEIYKNQKEQVTLIDRRKDENFCEIKKDFDSNVEKWKDEFKLSGQEKFYWKRFLLLKSAEYIKNINPVPLSERIQNNLSNDNIHPSQIYLGDIYKEKSNVCRHDAFLLKLLLEDYDVPVGIQSGRALYQNQIGAHTWNVLKTANGQILPFDVNADISDVWHFDFDGNVLYKETMLRSRLTKLDLLSMQLDDKLYLGAEETGAVVSNKMNPNADFFVEVTTDKDANYNFKLLDTPLTFENPKTESFVDSLNKSYHKTDLLPFLKLRYKADKKHILNLPNLSNTNGPLEAIDLVDKELNPLTRDLFAYWLVNNIK